MFRPKTRVSQLRINSCILLVCIVAFLSGCTNRTSIEEYKNRGIVVELPGSWNGSYDERSGTITLKASEGFWHPDTARIEIGGSACYPNLSGFTNPLDVMNAEIDRIRNLYDLPSVEIVNEPTKSIHEIFELYETGIQIPTTSMISDRDRIQVRSPKEGINQPVTVYVFWGKDGQFLMTASFYHSESQTLNSEAAEIITRLKVECE